MKNDRLLIKGKRFVRIILIDKDDMGSPSLMVYEGVMAEIELETGDFYPTDKVKGKKQTGKTIEKFKDTIALLVAKLLSSGFLELKDFRKNKAFFNNRVKLSEDTPHYVHRRLKKI